MTRLTAACEHGFNLIWSLAVHVRNLLDEGLPHGRVVHNLWVVKLKCGANLTSPAWVNRDCL